MQGIREVDVTFSRRRVMEFAGQWPANATPTYLESATLDLVDLIPTRYAGSVFNPTSVNDAGAPDGFVYPLESEPLVEKPAFPDPRFVVHYFMGMENTNAVLRRTAAEGNYFELILMTSAEFIFPGQWNGGITQILAQARIPFVGQQTFIDSLADDLPYPGEVQSGEVVMTGRYLKAVAVFGAASPGADSLTLGVFLTPVRG